ncbi:MAG: cytochrome c3 family protein, partial [Bryobacteraceae bacterium]
TTGATKHTPANPLESVGRELTSDELRKCFACHTTGDAPQVPLRAGSETGIHCERCHGPGREHIQAMTRAPLGDKKIAQPGRLEGFAQAQMCGACHGTPPEDTDLAGIRAIETNPNTVRFASSRLVLSRCFNESDQKLKCTTCHNPHEDAVQAAAQSDRLCLACHVKQARRKATVCGVSRDKCASCHMPNERVVAHSTFADHWIRVVR